jgi:hypothetical protein
MSQVALGPLFVEGCPTSEGFIICRNNSGKWIALDITRIEDALYVVKDGVVEYYMVYDADDAEKYREFTVQGVPKEARSIPAFTSFYAFDVFNWLLPGCLGMRTREDWEVKGVEYMVRRAWFFLKRIMKLDCTKEFENAVREFEENIYTMEDLAEYVENVGEYYVKPCRWLAAVVMLFMRAYDIEVSTQDYYTACDLDTVEGRVEAFIKTNDPNVFRGVYKELSFP